MSVVTRKLCKARREQAARVWIEGKALTDAGWKRGDRFSVSAMGEGENAAMILDRLVGRSELKSHHVAGTADRPIIDVTGENVRQLFGEPGTMLHIKLEPNVITITPAQD